jgi:hypothetical protein
MWECGRALRLPRGVQAGLGLTSLSPWPGGDREREGYLRSRAGAGAGQRGPRGPKGEACSPGTGERSRRARVGPRRLPGPVGCALAGEGGDALPACGWRYPQGGWRQRANSDAWVRLLRSQLSLGAGTERQTRSVGRSSCDSPEMMMGKMLSPLPSAGLCEQPPLPVVLAPRRARGESRTVVLM